MVVGVTAEILSPRAHWKKLCASCTCGNPWAAFTWEVSIIIAHMGLSIFLPSPTSRSFTENWAWCEGFNPMTYQTPPISYKVATISMLFCFFFTWSDDRNHLMFQISTSLFVLKTIMRKIFLGLSFWWNEPYCYSLSCFIPHISIAYGAFESLELLKHNLEAWDHSYSWLLNSSLRGIINNKIHCNSMQNKTNKIFLMSKQKNKVSVHLIPSEFSLLFHSQLIKLAALLLFPRGKQTCNAETRSVDTSVHTHVLGVGRKDRQ